MHFSTVLPAAISYSTLSWVRGTTIVAAEQTGRVCYGLELDPLYVDLAVRHW